MAWNSIKHSVWIARSRRTLNWEWTSKRFARDCTTCRRWRFAPTDVWRASWRNWRQSSDRRRWCSTSDPVCCWSPSDRSPVCRFRCESPDATRNQRWKTPPPLFRWDRATGITRRPHLRQWPLVQSALLLKISQWNTFKIGYKISKNWSTNWITERTSTLPPTELINLNVSGCLTAKYWGSQDAGRSDTIGE